MRRGLRCFVVAWAALAVVFSKEGRAAPEGCLDLGGLPRPILPPEDQRFLDDFGTALRRFKGLNVDEFLAEFGPGKEYRTEASNTAIFLRGDANGDGRMDLTDAVCTLHELFLGSGPCLEPIEEDALDADDSGKIDITDPIYGLNHLFTGGPAPPAPFPAAGQDPTPDGLRSSRLEGVGGKLGYDPLHAEYLPRITGKLGPLSEEQEVAYRENGFVILQDRRHQSFFHALDAVHANDLPVYVSADTILDALHLSFDEILRTIEEELLIGELNAMLAKLDEGIPALERYAGGRDIGRDLDHVAFWVATARSLLSGERAPSRRPGADPLIDEFLGHVAAETPRPIRLFGVDMAALGEPIEDFSQFKPRSHYAETEELQRYFRAMMWVQRIGARFAQCNAHAAAAFLLSRDLIDSGALEHWSRIDAVVKALVGTSDSLNAPGMAALAESAGVGSVASLYDEAAFPGFAQAALSSGAGRQLINSQVLGSNPSSVDGFTPLPPVFHVMGQRFIVDSFVFTNVVYDRVPPPRRDLPSPLDAWFVLGNRAALPLLEGELRTYDYASNLAAMNWIVSRYPENFWSANLYNVWLSALRSLDEDTTGSRYPPVMQTREWEKKTLNTQLGSWAQLRHDTLLYAKQSYSIQECEYPEGWVDPYPRFFATLADFAEKLRSELDGLGVSDLPSGERITLYATNLASHSRMLESIARAELDGTDLTSEQKAFVKSTMKRIPEEGRRLGSGVWPYNGWYLEIVFGLNPPQGRPGFEPVVADVHTCIGPGCGFKVLHVGVGMPELMLISIHDACGTRAYVGPVFSYHEFVGDRRWSDREWSRWLLDTTTEPPPRPAWLGDIVR